MINIHGCSNINKINISIIQDGVATHLNPNKNAMAKKGKSYIQMRQARSNSNQMMRVTTAYAEQVLQTENLPEIT
jgi:hypothetical protein